MWKKYNSKHNPSRALGLHATVPCFGLWHLQVGLSRSPAKSLTISCLGQNPNLETSEDVDNLLLGMSSQITKMEDSFVVEDLRGRSFHPFIHSLF